jgi:hypothetical protein
VVSDRDRDWAASRAERLRKLNEKQQQREAEEARAARRSRRAERKDDNRKPARQPGERKERTEPLKSDMNGEQTPRELAMTASDVGSEPAERAGPGS